MSDQTDARPGENPFAAGLLTLALIAGLAGVIVYFVGLNLSSHYLDSSVEATTDKGTWQLALGTTLMTFCLYGFALWLAVKAIVWRKAK